MVTLCSGSEFPALGGDQDMAGFVVGGVLLVVVGEQHGLALCAHQDLVLGHLEVEHMNGLAVVARCGEGGLVDHVGEVGTGEARCSAREDVQVDVLGHGDLLAVDTQNLFASPNVGPIDHDAAVEAAGAKQGGVEHVGTVCGGD